MSDHEYLGEPWTTLTEMKLRSSDPQGTIISLVTNEAGALLLMRGIVPAYLKQQCKEALEWCCTEARAPESERSLFDTETSDEHPRQD